MTSSPAISETSLWEWLKQSNVGSDRDLHMRRIENLVGVGDADVSGCHLSRYFDLELKTAARPARPTTVVLNSSSKYVRPEQKVWHRLRWLAGGNNYVLLQVGSGGHGKRYLLPGLYIRGIEDKTEEQLQNLSAAWDLEGLHSPLDVIKRACSYRSTLG